MSGTDAHISRRRPLWLEKGKRQNQLKPEHIQKIIAAYQHRTEEPRYSRRVELDEIVKNDFNLNISRFTGGVAQ
jgi:type I restriction enzyme M protein